MMEGKILGRYCKRGQGLGAGSPLEGIGFEWFLAVCLRFEGQFTWGKLREIQGKLKRKSNSYMAI